MLHVNNNKHVHVQEHVYYYNDKNRQVFAKCTLYMYYYKLMRLTVTVVRKYNYASSKNISKNEQGY